MALPDMQSGLLPPCAFPHPHRCTMAELYERFVQQAPFPDERELVFASFRIYGALIWQVLPSARLWVDGGFVTHKRWAAPGDADVAIVITREEFQKLSDDEREQLVQLLTLQDVSASSPGFTGLPRLQPMGGMIDGFLSVDTGDPHHQPNMVYWFDLWSAVTDEDKNVRHGVKKGFVEVVNPDA